VNQVAMLVTSEGEWVLPGSQAFLAALGDPCPDYDAVGFAVKNLGFIKLLIIDDLVVEIELHPRNVLLPALAALERQLLTSKITLFRIKYLDTEWHSEISASIEHTLSRLHELCTPVFSPSPNERFRIEPLDPAILLGGHSGENTSLGPLAQKWRITFGHFDSAVMGLASSQQLLPLMVIIGADQRDPDPVFRFIGHGHRWAGNDYLIEGVGERVENLPDKEYGAWVSQFYRSVITTGRPRYDLVTASLKYQGEPGTPQRMVRYERLLLPWKTTASGEIFISSCARPVSEATGSTLASESSESSVPKKPLKSS
jgi:hypothetical protein